MRIFIPNQVALIACAQFIVLKYGKKRLTIGKVLAAFGVVTAVAALAGVVIALPNLYEYTTSAPKIRGSWCVENEVVRRNTIYSSLFLVVIGGVFPFTLIVVCSIRSYLIVKRSTIEADKIVRSVISVNAATLSLEFVSKLPVIVASSLAFVHNSPAIAYFGISMSDTEYPFVLLLFMTTHRGIRSAVFSKVINYFSTPNAVAPQSELGAP